MPHPLVTQLRFARSEFVRGLEGLGDADARRRFQPMNCISWIIGHLSMQEQHYWLTLAQGHTPCPHLFQQLENDGLGATPPLADMWGTWRKVTTAADAYLDRIDDATLLQHFERDGIALSQSIGTLMLRNIYHYWYHTGEAAAVRQMLGHTDLPQFVGDMSAATFRLSP